MCAEVFTLFGLELWLAEHRDVRVPDDLAVASFDPVERHSVVRVLPPIPNAGHDHPAMLRAALELIERQRRDGLPGEAVRRVPAVMIGK